MFAYGVEISGLRRAVARRYSGKYTKNPCRKRSVRLEIEFIYNKTIVVIVLVKLDGSKL